MNAYTLLGRADAVTIDNGPLLYGWGTNGLRGIGDNEVIFFSWEEDGEEYSVNLTEDSINNGTWTADDAFLCEDSEGNDCTIRMFTLTQITPHNQ